MSLAAPAARRNSILAYSFGLTIAVFVAGIVAIALNADACTATSYTLTTTLPTTTWGDTTKWTPNTGYPGQCAGDTANVGLTGFTMQVDVTLQPVVLSITGGVPVTVASTGSLTLESSSSMTSSSSFTVNGGTLGVASGNSVTFQAPVTINSGNLTVAGTMTMSNGAQLNINGGTINGGGTITIPASQAMTFSGSGGAMVLSNTTVDNFGSVTLSSSSNALSINSGGHLTVESGGAFGLSNDAPIGTDGISSPSITVNSGGTMAKTGGTDSVVNVDVDNAGGTISAGTATLELLGGGTHTGAFNISGSTSKMRFNGTHTFNSGASIVSGALGGWELDGGTFNVNTALTVPTMKQTGGTLAGSANFSTTSSYDWAGGNMDGTTGGATTLGSSTLTIDPTSAVTLNARTITDSSSIAYNPGAGGSLTMQNGAQINLSGGTFDLQSDTAVIGDGTSSVNVTGGMLTKSTGTKTTIGCPININGTGTIKPSGTTIAFGNGGSIGGTTVGVDTSVSGSMIEFSGGTTSLNGGVTMNSANLALSGSAALAVNSSYGINNFTQDSSSTLTGNSAGLTVSGTYNWNGGTISASSLTSVVTIAATGILNITGTTGAMTLTSAAQIANAGTANYSPATNALSINSGGRFSNANILNLNSTVGITSDKISSPLLSMSGGSITKNGTGTLAVDVPMNISGGTVNVNGTLRFTDGGVFGSATLHPIASTDRFELTGASTTTFSSANWSGSGTLAISSPVTTNAWLATIANLELNSPGAISIASPQTLQATNLKWTGGGFTGGGFVQISGTTDMTALTATPTLSSITFNNFGTVTYNPSAFALTFNGSATFANQSGATVNVTGNGSFTEAASADSFTNAGTFKKLSGGGTISMLVPYTQTAGTTDCADPASTIRFSQSGTSGISGGSLTASNSTCAIDFSNGTFNIGGGTLSGPGPMQVNGAAVSVNTNTTLPSTFNVSAGTLYANASTITIPNAATLNWSGGSVSGSSGSVTLASGGTIAADSTNSSLIWNILPLLINSGATFSWNSGSNSLIFQSGATVNDSGTFTSSVGATLGSSGAGSFAVNGQFTHNAGNALTVTLPLNVQSGGTITSSGGGTILLSNAAGVSHAGTFDAQSGSMINFAAGTHQLNPGAAFSSGTGVYKVSASNLNLATNVTAPNFLLTGGAVMGSGNLDTTSTFTWQGGSMSGTGTTTIASGTGTLSTGALSLARNLTISGTTSMNDASGLDVGSGVTITNNSTFDLQNGNVTCTSCAGSTFANSGTLQKSSFPSLSTFAVPVTGSGALNVANGTFSDLATANYGSVTLAAGTSAIFNAATNITGNVGGTGLLEALAGTTTVGGTTTLTSGGAITVAGGTLTLNSTAATDTLNLTAGTLNGSGNLTVGTTASWTGGTLSGTGTATFNSNLTITGSTGPETLGRNATFNGAVFYTGPNVSSILTVNSGVTITSNNAFTFADQNINGTGANFNVGAGGSLLRTSGAAGTLTFGPFVSNAGTTTFSIGTTDFPNGFQQTAGSTTMNGGNLSSSFGFTFNGGTFTGYGTIAGAVTNGATLDIANSGNPATLNVTGNYTQTSAGTLNAKLNGTTAGTLYDQLVVGGNAALNGTFAATLGYTPANGDTFQPLQFAANAPVTDFATKNLPSMTPPGFLQASYVSGPPRALQLTAITQVADLGVTQTLPATALHNQNVTITVTVTNNGPSAASGVTVTDTFTNASFVSATIPGGSCTGSTCSLASLASGASATATIVLNANSVGTITNSATVSSSTFDNNNANDSTGAAAINVNPAADLGLLIGGTPNPVVAASTETFTITVGNNGPDAASSSVSATLSAGSINSAPGCTISGNSIACARASLASGATTTITINATAPANAASMTLSGSVTSAVADSNAANNSATFTASVGIESDLTITKSGPATAVPGSTINYTITVMNLGPSDAAGVIVTDPTPSHLAFVSASGACASFPCSIGSLPAGQSKSITATYAINATTPVTITNTASVSSTTTDPNGTNNSASAVTSTGCASTAPSAISPAANATAVATSGTLSWTNAGAAGYKVYLGPAGSGCNTLLGTTTATSFPYGGLTGGTQYEWRVEAVTQGCSTLSSACTPFTTVTSCPTTPPSLLAPANGAPVSAPVNFSWTAVTGATGYTVYAGVNGATPIAVGTTTDTTLSANVDNGAIAWFVTATIGTACPPLTSGSGTFSACTTAPPPIPAVVSTAASGQIYFVTWDAVNGASRYEIDEATKSDFSDAVTQSVNIGNVQFQHGASTTPLTFFYRVRSFSACDQKLGANSPALRVIIMPISRPLGQTPSVNVPAGSTQTVTQTVHVPGIPGGTFAFTAQMDKPFMTVTPSSGLLPPEGLDFTIATNPSGLDNGTLTGTLLLSIASTVSGHLANNGSTPTTSSTPVSINLVTPVSPTSGGAPPANALIIPSVGHLDGINSQWQSDVRVTNAGTSSGKYQLVFTPADRSTPKSTTITVGAGETVALDDIIRNWYGVGVLGDSANGVLQIAPTSGAKDGGVNIQTVASSRTYDVTTNGTLGQYIPAIPFASFIGAASGNALPTILSLQQIRQNDAFRTNLGLVEAAGKSANVVVTAFDATGAKMFDFPVTLAPNEQKQLNGFLAQQGVTSLSDGRFEVRVTGGNGKVTAYASLVDNRSGDPLLISGVPINAISANNYVLPGVADINNGLANWRSDVRVFNAGTAPQVATLTFYPLNNGGDPLTSSITINPGEVKQLDAILETQFHVANTGGALHVTTGGNSSLVVSGRTYNLAADGSTYGQFIPAVTESDAVAKNGAPLHVLQVEESVRYRTNIGVAEVTGKPATVEISVFVPNAKSTAVATVPLAANEYKQFDVLASLGLTNVYNARVALRVVDGDGKVTAYGSVIDMTTQDPTYVPAQQ